MTDVTVLRDARPLAAAGLERGADFGVELDVHARTISKFCARRKQPFARGIAQSIAMHKKSMNQLLAETLDALMRERSLSNNELGKRAGVAPNTIANYREIEQEFTSKGKTRSAKLSEIELIAEALGVDPIALMSGQVRVAQSVSLPSATVPPEEPPMLSWRVLTMKNLPPVFRVAMPDDAMAPAAEAGWVVEFEATDVGEPGMGVLVRTASGEVYFREYVQGRGGGWEAHPSKSAFLKLESGRDGLVVIAKLRHILRPKL